MAERQERHAVEQEETDRRLAILDERLTRQIGEQEKRRAAMGDELDRRIAALVAAITKLSESTHRHD